MLQAAVARAQERRINLHRAAVDRVQTQRIKLLQAAVARAEKRGINLLCAAVARAQKQRINVLQAAVSRVQNQINLLQAAVPRPLIKEQQKTQSIVNGGAQQSTLASRVRGGAGWAGRLGPRVSWEAGVAGQKT